MLLNYGGEVRNEVSANINAPEMVRKICHEIGTDKNGKPIYKKAIEARKTKPSIPTPFKCYIYCTKGEPYLYRVDDDNNFELTNVLHPNSDGYVKDYNAQNGKIIGEFICDKVDEYTFSHYEAEYRVTHVEQKEMCLNQPELIRYGKGETLYGWHISQLEIYGKPKALWQFCKCGAKSFKELCDTGEICEYCQYSSHGLYLCEGRFCDETYEVYLDNNFTLTSPPQSWRYVKELERRIENDKSRMAILIDV